MGLGKGFKGKGCGKRRDSGLLNAHRKALLASSELPEMWADGCLHHYAMRLLQYCCAQDTAFACVTCRGEQISD